MQSSFFVCSQIYKNLYLNTRVSPVEIEKRYNKWSKWDRDARQDKTLGT